MIRVYLLGGLGNQMFQFAYGYAMKRKYNHDLVINTALLGVKGGHVERVVDLNKFQNVSDEFIFENELDTSYYLGQLCRRIPYLSYTIKSQIILENCLTDLENQLEFCDKNYHIIGYWQNLFNFSDFREDLLALFNFGEAYKGLKDSLAKKILGRNAVSIHIRQGDYINNASNYEVLSTAYYEKAVLDILENNSEIYCFIFGQNLDFLDDIFKLKSVHIIKMSGNEPFEDMYYMSLFRYNIIANSTFSLWAAWLNQRQDKIVYAPNKWFINEEKNHRMIQSLPAEWRKL